jgi:hypothetical protein
MGDMFGVRGPDSLERMNALMESVADLMTHETGTEVRWINVPHAAYNPLRETGFFVIETPEP